MISNLPESTRAVVNHSATILPISWLSKVPFCWKSRTATFILRKSEEGAAAWPAEESFNAAETSPACTRIDTSRNNAPNRYLMDDFSKSDEMKTLINPPVPGQELLLPYSYPCAILQLVQ